MIFCIKTSYGNDSVACIQLAHELGLRDVWLLYNDTGWAREGWLRRVADLEAWAKGLGFKPARTSSEGMLALVARKKSWPRQGIQFCTSELKIGPSEAWLTTHDPMRAWVNIIGVRREESEQRKDFPEFSYNQGRKIWAPLVSYTSEQRDALLHRAGVVPLLHRSDECWPCINANRPDLLRLDEARIAEIESAEQSMGFTSKGAPRTMYRPYRYMGATGIHEIVRWARSERGKFSLDDGNGAPGCDAGSCGG